MSTKPKSAVQPVPSRIQVVSEHCVTVEFDQGGKVAGSVRIENENGHWSCTISWSKGIAEHEAQAHIRTALHYFASLGGTACPDDITPASWKLEVIAKW